MIESTTRKLLPLFLMRSYWPGAHFSHMLAGVIRCFSIGQHGDVWGPWLWLENLDTGYPTEYPMGTNLVTHAVDGCLILPPTWYARPQLRVAGLEQWDHQLNRSPAGKVIPRVRSSSLFPGCDPIMPISWFITFAIHSQQHFLLPQKPCYTSLPGSWPSQISRFWGLGVDELCGTSSQVSTRKKGEKRVRCRSSPATSREIHSKHLKRSEKKTSCLFIFWISMYVIMYMFFFCGQRLWSKVKWWGFGKSFLSCLIACHS